MPYIKWNDCEKAATTNYVRSQTVKSAISKVKAFFCEVVENDYREQLLDELGEFFSTVKGGAMERFDRFPVDDLYVNLNFGAFADILREMEVDFKAWTEATEIMCSENADKLEQQLWLSICKMADLSLDESDVEAGIYDRVRFEQEFNLDWQYGEEVSIAEVEN